MPIATGINTVVAYKKETTWGTLAGATGGKIARRVTAEFSLTKETYQSEEIRVDYQMADFRHGVRSAEGTINGELSPGSYSDFFGSVLARVFTVGVTTGSQTNISATAGNPGTIVRAAGSFLTDGFRVGDVVRATGFTATVNNTHNFLVTAVTALVLTVIPLDGVPVAVSAAGPATVVAVTGRKTWAPLTGHTDESYTIEKWYSDALQSEVFTGMKLNSLSVQLPASGLATIDMSFMGKDLTQVGVTQYFTTPAAASTSGILAAANGVLVSNGTAIGLITGLNFTVNRNLSMEAVVGSNTVPDIFEGRIMVDGEFTVFFQDAVFRDAFVNETELTLIVALTTTNVQNADFICFTLPRIKVGTATKGDGEQGIIQTHSFQALLYGGVPATTGIEATTLQIQDSLAT